MRAVTGSIKKRRNLGLSDQQPGTIKWLQSADFDHFSVKRHKCRQFFIN
jgi:hypothetical protein